MLKVNNINKSFGNLKVLNNVSLEVDDAEILSIMGPSGAGKSTLLQIIGTLDRPDSGEVLFDGTDVWKLSDKEISYFRNRNIGFVFQSHQLLPEFSLLENVMMPALIRGDSRKKAGEMAMELLNIVGLEGRASHRPAQMSGGECQRGAVARALINRPKVILADEPTGSLDSGNRNELQQLLFEMRDRYHCTILIVTHDIWLGEKCDRIVNIADGILKQ